MKTIPTQFRKDGFDYTQIERVGNIAIYSQGKPHWKNCAYEVVRIRVRPASSAFGKDFPEMERYPWSEEWGVYGWTYSDLESAKRRLRSLVESPEGPTPLGTKPINGRLGLKLIQDFPVGGSSL